jgi:chromate transporter
MNAFTLIPAFASLSLIAVGGANAVLPEIHRQIVENHHWLSEMDFGNLFAIAQAAPGPNVLFVTLVGWKLAGFAGALSATLAMLLPAALLTHFAAGVWDRFREAPWRMKIQAALTPLTIGLVTASGYLLLGTLEQRVSGVALALATALVAFRTEVNPLYLLALGAVAGLSGLV